MPAKTHGATVGGKFTPTYSSWAAMLSRCRSPHHRAYPRYGGRGIKVAKRWLKFENFLSDMGERPIGKTIDRIKKNIGYRPSNCRWANRSEQQNNMSTNKILKFNGRSLTVSQWAKELDLSVGTIHSRLARGCDVRRALRRPWSDSHWKSRIIEFNGVKLTVSQWAEKLGYERDILYSRLGRKWSIKRMLTQPIQIRGEKTNV